MWTFVFIVLAAIFIYWIAARGKKEIQPQYITKTITLEDDINRFIFAPTNENKAILQALAFIGKADGQMRQDECDVMIRFLKEKQPEHLPSYDEFLTESLRSLKKLSYQEYKQTISGMNKGGLTEFISWTNRIIGTQASVHPFEEVLLDNLAESIKKFEEGQQAA